MDSKKFIDKISEKIVNRNLSYFTIEDENLLLDILSDILIKTGEKYKTRILIITPSPVEKTIIDTMLQTRLLDYRRNFIEYIPFTNIENVCHNIFDLVICYSLTKLLSIDEIDKLIKIRDVSLYANTNLVFLQTEDDKYIKKKVLEYSLQNPGVKKYVKSYIERNEDQHKIYAHELRLDNKEATEIYVLDRSFNSKNYTTLNLTFDEFDKDRDLYFNRVNVIVYVTCTPRQKYDLMSIDMMRLKNTTSSIVIAQKKDYIKKLRLALIKMRQFLLHQKAKYIKDFVSNQTKRCVIFSSDDPVVNLVDTNPIRFTSDEGLVDDQILKFNSGTQNVLLFKGLPPESRDLQKTEMVILSNPSGGYRDILKEAVSVKTIDIHLFYFNNTFEDEEVISLLEDVPDDIISFYE